MVAESKPARSALGLLFPHLSWAVPATLTVLVCVALDPISFESSHAVSLVLSLWAVLLVLAFALTRWGYGELVWPWPARGELRRGAAVKVVYVLLLCSSIVAAFNYYKLNAKQLTGVNDYMDVTYYYVNSKYFEELGHFDLYEALLIADDEGAKRMRKVKRFRDLRTYDFAKRSKAFRPERIEQIKSQFTAQRWTQFKSDVDFLTRHYRNWSYLMVDRGYNPPATWTFVGGTLSRLTPIEHMKIITMIDFLLIFVMFILIGRAFGAHALLFALLWFGLTFSGRWPILGQALLRFDWVATSVMAVCLWKLKRPGWAGGLLMYATLSRVFPILLFFAWFIGAVRVVVEKKALPREDRRFIFGAVTVLAVMVTGTIIQLGPSSFLETYQNLKLHAASYSSHRVGLADLFLYQGEWTGADVNANGGIAAKTEQFRSLKALITGIGLAVVAFLSVYIWRMRRPAYELIHLAIIPFFCVTAAQTNYYNVRLLLILAHASDLSKWRNRVGLALLFLVETLTQGVMVAGATRYAVTSWMSIGLSVYFVVYLGFLAWELRCSYRPARPALEPQ